MKRLAICKWAALTAAVICASFTVAALCMRFSGWEYCTVYTLMGATLVFTLFFIMRKRLTAAQAIAESSIIRIQPAVIYGETAEGEEEEELYEKYGIYVSCFGILMGTRIIKFNRDDIWLKKVEIGQDYISFGYGEDNGEIQNIRLLYSRPSDGELSRIVEKFREETGTVPAIV